MNLHYHFRRITNNSGQFVTYFNLEKDAVALRGQLLFRSKHLGMKELDLVIGSWATHNLNKLDHAELTRFNDQVLLQETPDLLKKILGDKPIEDGQQLLRQIRQFAVDSSYSKIEQV